jgi:hypothetical protein
MKRMKEFWADLNNALVEAKCMSVSDASAMIETRLDEYCDLWPHIEAACAGNLFYLHMITRAFAVRYMLDHAVIHRGNYPMPWSQPGGPLTPARKRRDR